jgi:hypothetical protein
VITAVRHDLIKWQQEKHSTPRGSSAGARRMVLRRIKVKCWRNAMGAFHNRAKYSSAAQLRIRWLVGKTNKQAGNE